MSFSVRVSTDDVASSRMRTGAPRRPRAQWRRAAADLTEVCAVGIEHGVIALRQMRDEIVRVGDLRRADAVLIRRVQPAVADVFHHGAGKQMRVLQDDTERPAEVILLDIAHVDAVIGDVAA